VELNGENEELKGNSTRKERFTIGNFGNSQTKEVLGLEELSKYR